MTTKEICNVLYSAPVDWNGWVSDREPGALFGDIRDVDAAIEKLARFRGYVDANLNATTHAAGVNSSNKLAGKIRKALGHTISKHDVRF